MRCHPQPRRRAYCKRRCVRRWVDANLAPATLRLLGDDRPCGIASLAYYACVPQGRLATRWYFDLCPLDSPFVVRVMHRSPEDFAVDSGSSLGAVEGDILGGYLPPLVPVLLATPGVSSMEWGAFLSVYQDLWASGFPDGRSSSALALLGPSR